jgi:putative hemolysin
MDFRMPASLASALVRDRSDSGDGTGHIVDQLIAERATRLSRHPLWPILRPLLYRYFHYRQAVSMADDIALMPGREAFDYLSRLLSLDIQAIGMQNLPREGGFILAPSHPTGIADGIAVYDLLKSVRPDMAIFANRDALRVAAGFGDLIIPVEWRQGQKTHSKSRDTLEMTARCFAAGKAVVLFPSGRIAYWHGDRLTERPWQGSVVALARRFQVPVVPVNMTARNSGLFYLLSRYSAELRDMTVFHELLNKKSGSFRIVVGRPIPPDLLDGEAADVAALLQQHTVERLPREPEAEFTR